MNDLTGLPLSLALERMKARGESPRIVYTKAPRHPVLEGEARVLRVQADGALLVALFPPPAWAGTPHPETP